MDYKFIILGYAISTLGGQAVLWPFGRWAWAEAEKYLRSEKNPDEYSLAVKGKGYLSGTMGITERIWYTSAIIMGVPDWIGGWLAIKTALQFQSVRPRGTVNIFLVGNAISLLFGFIGAWIALDFEWPILKAP